MHLGGQGLQQRAWVLGESYVSSASRAISTAAHAAPLASKAERKADNNALAVLPGAPAQRGAWCTSARGCQPKALAQRKPEKPGTTPL